MSDDRVAGEVHEGTDADPARGIVDEAESHRHPGRARQMVEPRAPVLGPTPGSLRREDQPKVVVALEFVAHLADEAGAVLPIDRYSAPAPEQWPNGPRNNASFPT